MAISYLKKSPKTSSTDDTKTREIVENILKDEEEAVEVAKKYLSYFQGSIENWKEPEIGRASCRERV